MFDRVGIAHTFEVIWVMRVCQPTKLDLPTTDRSLPNSPVINMLNVRCGSTVSFRIVSWYLILAYQTRSIFLKFFVSGILCMCACMRVCVCERERERERAWYIYTMRHSSGVETYLLSLCITLTSMHGRNRFSERHNWRIEMETSLPTLEERAECLRRAQFLRGANDGSLNRLARTWYPR